MLEIEVIKFITQGGEGYIPYISRHMFSNDVTEYCFTTIEKHYTTHKKVPTLDELKLSLYQKFSDKEDKRRIRRYLRQIKEKSITKEFTEDIIKDLVQKSQMRGILQTVIPQLDSLNPLNMDLIREQLERVIATGVVESPTKLNDTERRKRDRTNSVPTFSDTLNMYLDPGLAPGELGLIQANPGIGKTMVCLNLVIAAAVSGFPAWYVTLDEMGCDIADRFDLYLGRFKKRPSWAELIYLIDFSDGRPVSDLGLMVERTDSPPGLVILDGTDEFLGDDNISQREQINVIYKGLRRLSRRKKNPIPIWLTSQSTAASESKLRKTMQDLAENKVTKAAETSVILSLNQTEEEARDDVFRIFISKIRRKFGKWESISCKSDPLIQTVIDLEVKETRDDIKEGLKKKRGKKKKKI